MELKNVLKWIVVPLKFIYLLDIMNLTLTAQRRNGSRKNKAKGKKMNSDFFCRFTKMILKTWFLENCCNSVCDA